MLKCKNCQHQFSGKYCNNCGEKVVEDQDFNLRNILSEAIGAITNLDSKIFQSLKLLFFYPGKLTQQYIDGIRVPYMKPFQIFLIANLVFFIFLSELDLFRSPSKWFFTENFDGIRVMDKVREISAAKDLTTAEIASRYDRRSADLAKGLIIILVPFIALITMLLNIRKKIQYGKHVIYALHYFSFVLLFCVIWTEGFSLLGFTFNRWYFIVPITFTMLLYYVISLKGLYENNWVAAIIKGIIGVFLINVMIQLYRMSINVFTLNTI